MSLKRKIPPKNYYTGKSKIHGKGVFAKKDFPAGSLVGKLHTIKPGEEYDYTTLGKNYNHSDTPNAVNVVDDKMSRHLVTTKDIKKGEELTADYRLQPDLEQPEDFGKTSLQNGGVAEKEADKYQFNWGDQPEVGGLTSPVSSILPEKVNYKYSDVGLEDYGKVLAAGPAAPLIFPSETKQIAKSMFVDPVVRLKNKGFMQVLKDLGYTTADIVALGYNQLTNPGPFSSTTLTKAMTETNPITGLPYGEGAESALDVSTYLGLGIGAVAKTGAKQLITKGIPKVISKTKATIPNPKFAKGYDYAKTTPGTTLTEAEIQLAVNKNLARINHPDYIAKRAANTGESVKQIQKEIAKYTKEMKNMEYSFRPSERGAGEYFRPKFGNLGLGRININPSSRRKMIGVLDHEIKHGVSPAARGTYYGGPYKNYPNLPIQKSNFPLSKNRSWFNKKVDKFFGEKVGKKWHYYDMPSEQQVRFNRFEDIMHKMGVPKKKIYSAEDVDKGMDFLNKTRKMNQNPNLDIIRWLQNSIKKGEKFDRTAFRELLNKAWVVPAAVGLNENYKHGGTI